MLQPGTCSATLSSIRMWAGVPGLAETQAATGPSSVGSRFGPPTPEAPVSSSFATRK